MKHPQTINENKLCELIDIQKSNLKALIKKELSQLERREIYRDPYEKKFPKTENLTLTNEQEKAIQPIIQSIHSNDYKTFLLYGVTGSGKTEIYLQSIEKVIRQGKEAIVLEIGRTSCREREYSKEVAEWREQAKRRGH